MRLKDVNVQRFRQHIGMLLSRLDVMDSNYTTLYRVADDVVCHVHVSRTPAAETLVAIFIALSLSSLITMLSSISGAKKYFACQRKRSSFTTSASTICSDLDDAAAITFCALENQLIAPPPASPLRVKPNAECLGKWQNRRPPIPTVLCTTPALLRR